MMINILRSFHKNFNWRLLGLLAIIAIFIVFTLWIEPLPYVVHGQTTPTPAPVTLSDAPVATPLPAELLENTEQTNGIVLGAIILILIVLISCFSVIRTRNKLNGVDKPA